jgi:predicted ATPase/DNA-binding SARP family transcriptional activator
MLQIRLLGKFELQLDGQIVDLPSRPAQSLLAYLATTAGTKHRREKLAGMLWPESEEENARSNLRHALWRLRKALGEGYFQSDKVSLSFGGEAGFWVDASEFENRTAAEPLERQIEVLSLYAGELLPGFYDEWADQERERLQSAFERKMDRLVEGLIEKRRWDQAQEWAERWISLSTAPEPAYRALMTTHAAHGDTSKVAVVYDRLTEALEQELGVAPSDETRELYQRLSKGERIAEARAPLHNLPPRRTPFVGRATELAAVLERLRDPECRLLTLAGPGGIGKTRIAVRAARELVEDFVDGVFFVPLAPVRSEVLLVSGILEQLEFELAGAMDPKDELIDYLREKEMLLILDSFEHLLQGAGLVSDLLTGAPGLKVMTTSWERLNLQSEWVVEISGMPVPEEQFVQSDVATLFVHSAQRIQPGFEMAAEESPAVMRICQLVDGLPLAVELAASWVRMLTPVEIAAEIEQGIDFLKSSLRDLPERHRSMRAVFDHSWKLLPESELQVFRKLSVFRGGFDREQAAQVAGASLTDISALVDRSYIHIEPSGRYDIHELLRQYAQARLELNSDEAQEVKRLHAEAFMRLLDEWQEALRGGKRKQALEVLAPEIDNIRQAWEWATLTANTMELSNGLEGLWLFYDIRSWFLEGMDALTRASQALAAQQTGGAAEAVRARALGRSGWFAWRMGRYEDAENLAKGSLEIAQQFDLASEIAFSQTLQGQVAFARGRYKQAKDHYRAALSIWRETRDSWGTSVTLLYLGLAAHALGEYSEAKQPYTEGLQIFKQIGYQYGATFSFDSLGKVARSLVELKEAKKVCMESLQIRRELDDPWGVAACLDSLAAVETGLGEFANARAACEESLELRRSLEDRRGTTTALGNLSHVAYLEERFDEAHTLATEALVLREELGDRKGVAASQNAIAEIELKLGALEAAASNAHKAHTTRKALGDRAGSVSSLHTISRIAFAEQDYPAAIEWLNQALRESLEIDAVPLSLEALGGLAAIAAQIGNQTRAAELAAFVTHHAAAPLEVKAGLQELWRDLNSGEAAEALTQAYEAGKQLDLEAVAQRVLSDS